MEMRPISESVEFRHFDSGSRSNELPELELSELSEREFVESCGATVPGETLGSRVSFDRAQSLVWSTDGASIYYLASADSQDVTRSAGLRAVRLADAAASELLVVPFGKGVQIDSSGQVYVGGRDNLLKVVAGAGGPATIAIPVPADAVVSPDGRWLASESPSPLRVWDLQSGAEAGVAQGLFGGWSQDSRLAYWSLDNATLEVVLPTDLLGELTHYASSWDSTSSVVWTKTGPMLAHVPLNWEIYPGFRYTSEECMECFGLSLQDPIGSVERSVIDASAGMIHIVKTPPLVGFMFVWARSCLGLFDTVCSYSLLRVSLPDGVVQKVATAYAEYPVAVSPDYRHIAIAAPTGIYVADLPM
jgi:hypothetical protein